VSVVEVTTHGGTRRISNVDSPGTYEVGTRNYRQSLLLASKLPASRVDRTPHRHEARAVPLQTVWPIPTPCFSFVRRYYEERAAPADICAAQRLARLALPTARPQAHARDQHADEERPGRLPRAPGHDVAALKARTGLAAGAAEQRCADRLRQVTYNQAGW